MWGPLALRSGCACKWIAMLVHLRPKWCSCTSLRRQRLCRPAALAGTTCAVMARLGPVQKVKIVVDHNSCSPEVC